MQKQKPNEQQENHIIQKMFNINFKNFQIPQCHGSTINRLKRYSKLRPLVAQSGSEIKAPKDKASFMPTSVDMIAEDWKNDNDELSRINEEDNVNDFQVSKLIENNTKSVTSSSSSNSDKKLSSDSAVSNKFVINIKEDKYEAKKEREKDNELLNISKNSWRLCTDDLESEKDICQMKFVKSNINLQEVMKINQPPSLSCEDDSSDKATTLNSNDSSYTDSKVSVNRNFIVSLRSMHKLSVYILL